MKDGGVSVMMWGSMAAQGSGSNVFIDDAIADKGRSMSSV